MSHDDTSAPPGYDRRYWEGHLDRMRRLGLRSRLSDRAVLRAEYGDLALRARHPEVWAIVAAMRKPLPPGWKPPVRDERTEVRVAALAREVGRNARRRRKAALAPTAARPRDRVYRLDPREVERTLDELVASAGARIEGRREARRREIGEAFIRRFGTSRRGVEFL